MRRRPSQHIEAEHSNTGAAIENKGHAILCAYLHARRVTPINGCSMTWCWNRTACSPKSNVHLATLCKTAMFSAVRLAVKHIVAPYLSQVYSSSPWNMTYAPGEAT